MAWPKPEQLSGKPKLTEAQIEHLRRIAAGGEFTGSIPEHRLISMGLLRVTGAVLSVQGTVVIAKLPAAAEKTADAAQP